MEIEHGHEPVMMEEVLRHLSVGEPPGAKVFLDCTLGRGGHSEQVAKAMALAGGGTVIGMDVDPDNLKYARKRLEGFAGQGVEVRTFHANFGEAEDVLEAVGMLKVDLLLADFGVSTNQLLEGRHGLSFSGDEKLDMRLDPRITMDAADLLKEWDDKKIAGVLQDYAQERFAWRIARKIVSTRVSEPIQTTGQLARLVRSVLPPQRYGQIDPATRTFQALRMAVNSELEAIEDLLAIVPAVMSPGGRAVFLSFHSGEDRLVKQAVKSWDAEGLCEILTKKPAEPTESEINRNPRSRSAKLRAVRFQ